MTEPPLEWLALARGTLDRAAELRRDEAFLASAWTDPRTRVLVVERGKALVSDGDAPALALLPPAQAPAGERWLMGQDASGAAYFTVPAPLPAVEGTRPAGLREVGALLDDLESGLLTQSVALEHWHATHGHCPRCGAPTEVRAAGHVRRCPQDGAEQFPRLDPAVIMLVQDDDGNVLLARGPQWPADRRSILAGFVEPGESLEQAVAREVKEEVGIPVQDVHYLGSQPWPLPQSLMLGFFARTPGSRPPLYPDDDEITDAAWYSRDELRAAVDAGDIVAPGPLSIAAQLIMRWFGGPLPKMPAF
ncbi:NAD(+) diphosphatase [Actinomadura parmotrematis]|uniref:NAD(+) diphosphatase n=1 Tax=Actinomadura parmotrematis TaxID=2864039 RepID=A0ABS7G0W8_9ACTN|nr:NAD(+) diphosphatase [Actinomadura parmotrematis]MBW8486317.1 NAD(+) diphosphatase [Actinomadura parmotrematis]